MEIRAEIATGRGAALRRATLRATCASATGAGSFERRSTVSVRQFALLLPVGPTIALKDLVLGGTVGGGILGGGIIAPSALKSAVAKGVVGAMSRRRGNGRHDGRRRELLHVGGSASLRVRHRLCVQRHAFAHRAGAALTGRFHGLRASFWVMRA